MKPASPCHEGHGLVMLQRNPVYTAIRRAKRLVVLVGTRRAIGIAVHNDKVRERHSRLGVQLREG